MKTQQAIISFLNNRRAQNLSPQTIQLYQVILRKFVLFCPVLPSDPERVEEFLTSLAVSPETKYGYFKVLKTFYRFIATRHDLPNPMTQISPPRCPKKVMPTLEPQEIMQLVNEASNLRDKALMTLFADTGARLSEIASLRRQDIKRDVIKVRGKTGEREIPISDETERLLLALSATRGNNEHVFISHSSARALSKSGLYFITHSLMVKAGILGPKLGPHRLRHAFGKNYLVSGGDIRSLQQIMGHANITTTEKYASLSLNDVIAKHHKFSPLRAAHTTAQGSFLESIQAVKEAEDILTAKSQK